MIRLPARVIPQDETNAVLSIDELDEIERISRHVLDWAARVVEPD